MPRYGEPWREGASAGRLTSKLTIGLESTPDLSRLGSARWEGATRHNSLHMYVDGLCGDRHPRPAYRRSRRIGDGLRSGRVTRGWREELAIPSTAGIERV